MGAIAEPTYAAASGPTVAEQAVAVAKEFATPAEPVRLMATRFLGPKIRDLYEQPATATTAPTAQSEGPSLVSRMLNFAVYAVFVVLFALWYTNYGSEHFQPREEMKPTQLVDNSFTFGLFSCLDEPLLCCLSCCCGPVRWSDTMSKVGEMSLAMGILMYLICYGLDYITATPLGFVLAAFCALKRQRLRAMYKLPYGHCGDVCEDFCTYLCCAPCAITQEARQVELYPVSS